MRTEDIMRNFMQYYLIYSVIFHTHTGILYINSFTSHCYMIDGFFAASSRVKNCMGRKSLRSGQCQS
jgi:hypothetical protein